MQNGTTEFEQQEAEIHLRDYFIVLLARKWLVIFGFLAVVGAAIYYIQTTEPVYKATVELLHEKQSTMPLIVESFQFASTSLELEAQRRIIKSPLVIGPAMLSLNNLIPNFSLTSKEIESNIELDSPRGSTIFELSATAGSPREAALIANTVAAFYRDNTTERKKKDLKSALKFLEQQKKTLEAMLEQDTEQLQLFRKKVGLSPTASANPTANSSLLNQLWKYHEDLVKAEWEKEMANVQLNSVEELIEEKEREIDLELETDAPLLEDSTSEIKRLNDKLLNLNLELETKLYVDDLKESHYEVKVIRRQIQSVNDMLDEEEQKLINQQKQGTLNPISEWQNLMQQSRTLTFELERAKKKEKLIKDKIDQFNKTHPELVSQEVEQMKLERQQKLHEETAIHLAGKYQDTQLLVEMQTSDIEIIRKAPLPEAPIKPKKKLTVALAVVLGLMLGVGAAFFLEYMDDSIKRKEDIERYIGAPVIGAIPHLPKAENFELPLRVEKRRRGATAMFDNPTTDASGVSLAGEDGKPTLIITANNPGQSDSRRRKHRSRSQVKEIEELASRNLTLLQKKHKDISESYRGLLANIEYSSIDEKTPQVLLITSSTPKEGKTTTTANLAITMAQMGKKTLLVDCDLKRPRQHALFLQAREPGLSDYLLSDAESTADASDDLPPSLDNGLIRETDVDNLHLLTCGKPPHNSMALVSSKKMEDLIVQWRDDYDYVLFDSPPVLSVADAGILSTNVDATLLIVKVGATKQKVAEQAAEQLSKAGNLFGVILNNMEASKRYGYYYYYYYYYSSRYNKYYSADDDEEV